MKNIRTFLQTCQNVFELKDEHLFQPYMLFDYTDFGKVCCKLEKMLQCEKSYYLLTSIYQGATYIIYTVQISESIGV